MNRDDINLASNLRRSTSLSQRPQGIYTNAIDQDVKVEKNPYINTLVSKGTVQTTGGGLVEFNSKSGGTILLTVDPVTGNVTVAGPVIANVTLNVGSMNNGAITGASNWTGTLTGNGIISGGTFNNIVIGTPKSTGGTASNLRFETPIFDTSAGSAALNISGEAAIKVVAGTGVWLYRLNGTTYFVNPSGTLIP